jgi:peroxiredoxin
MAGKYKWHFMAVALLLTGIGGLLLGKARESEYMKSLYARTDFTLLDDSGDFFSISSLPEKKLALLIFTPDGIPVETVKPMHEFSQHLDDLRKMGIEPMLISRTNRDIVRNFKHASRFPARVLLDSSGTVGRNTGIWDGLTGATYWGYALVNRRNEVLWLARENELMSFEKLKKTLLESR